jgi:signal transduction histidine kinase
MTAAPQPARPRVRAAKRSRPSTSWDLFDRDVVDPLYASIDAGAPVRAWVVGAGDASIPLAVTLGLLCGAARREHSGALRVIATEPEFAGILLARAATLSASFLRALPAAWRDAAAHVAGEPAAISAWVRRHVIFSSHRFGVDPPFSQLDLVVTCHGAVVPEPIERRVARQLAFALREGGALWSLGAPMFLDATDFESNGPSGRLFRRVRRHVGRAEVDGLLSDVVAAERFRMGEHLHDGIGQHLTALSLGLHRLRGAAKTPELQPLIARLEDMLVGARSDLRAIARGKLPLALDATGLVEGLESAVADARRVLVTDVELEVKNEVPPLGGEVVTQLVRIAQEALRNGAASGAQRVVVTLQGRSRGVELAIRDNGGGMARQHPYRSLGLGLRIMRHRADLIGASLRFASDERGTTILCTL